MTLTEKFFVECVKKGIKSQVVEQIPQELEYKKFHKLCTSHSMSVVVYKALEKVRTQLNKDFLAILEAYVRRHVALDVQSEYDKEKFLSALEEKGLKYMPLKGYYLKKLYPSTDMRYASDFDVLIDAKELNKVREVSNNLGLKVMKYDEHHDVFYNPQTKTIFELHKILFVGRLQKYFGVGFERAHLREGTKAFYELNKEDFYISILAHSAYHFAEDAGVGIRHLTDVYLYKNAYKLDYEYLDRELQKCGLKKFKDKFELMADYLFDDAKVDDETLTLVEHVIESSVLANKKMQGASEVASNMEEGGAKNAKRKTLWKTLFPPKSHMQFTYPVLKKAGFLLPFFYPIRWVHVLFTRPKNIKKIKGISEVDKDSLSQMKKIRSTLGLDEF